MDIPRPKSSRLKPRHWTAIAGGLGALLLVGFLSRVKAAAPSVERASVLIDSVKRGPMVFEVRGSGVLVPVEVRILTAQTGCIVERILVYPGTEVKPDTVIAELSSPELNQAAQDALWQLRSAEAEFEVGYLNQKATVEATRANAQEAEATYRAHDRLQKEGLQSGLEVLRAKARAEEFRGRLAAEEARLKLYENRGGQSGPARAKLEQARAVHTLKREQFEALRLRSGMAGMLQQLPLQVGQQLAPGAILAKVAKSLPLKAELKVSETQARDILIGQPVVIDTRNGLVKGRVIRIDPSVQNGTVTVDARIDGDLPKGARPDLSVEGIVELDRAASALFTGRPVQAQSFGVLSVFKLSADGSEAHRIKIKLGRASVSSVEILEGLREGDQIILSDTSQYEGVDRIRLR